MSYQGLGLLLDAIVNTVQLSVAGTAAFMQIEGQKRQESKSKNLLQNTLTQLEESKRQELAAKEKALAEQGVTAQTADQNLLKTIGLGVAVALGIAILTIGMVYANKPTRKK